MSASPWRSSIAKECCHQRCSTSSSSTFRSRPRVEDEEEVRLLHTDEAFETLKACEMSESFVGFV